MLALDWLFVCSFVLSLFDIFPGVNNNRLFHCVVPFQGILFATNECCKIPVDLVRLYMHEASRVYRDKLVDDKDIEQFDKLLKDAVKKSFEDMSEIDLYKQPMLFCHFAVGIGEAKYLPIQSYAELNKTLVDALDNHNEMQTAMNLVLFEVSVYSHTSLLVLHASQTHTSQLNSNSNWHSFFFQFINSTHTRRRLKLHSCLRTFQLSS